MATYGLSSAFSGDKSFDAAIEKAAVAGFRQMELSAGNDTPFSTWMADADDARRRLSLFGIRARSVHVGSAGWDLADPDDESLNARIAIVTACLGPAVAVGAEVVICHHSVGSNPFPAKERLLSMQRSRESLAVVADRAGEAGIKIAVENLPQRGTRRPGGPIADVLKIIDGLGDHVGVCIDGGHSNSNGQSPASEARAAGEKVFAVHIQDNDGSGADQHLLPGEGTTDWPPFIEALDDVAPACVRTLEVRTKEGQTAEELLAALARIRNEWE